MIKDASKAVAQVRYFTDRFDNYKRSQNKKLVRNTFVVTAAVITALFRRQQTSTRIMKHFQN